MIGLAVIPGNATGQAQRVTLEQAIAMAMDANPNMVQALGDVRVAGAQRREAIGDWLPSISGNSGVSTNSTSRFDDVTQRQVSGNSTSYSAGLSASLTLFDGFRRSANIRSAGASLESAHASLTTQRFDVVLQTKQAFYNAVASEELVHVAETRIERAQNQLRIARDKLAAGSAIRSDTLRSFVELGNARLQLLNAQTQRATSTANLARLIGVDAAVEVVPDPTLTELVRIDTTALRTEAFGGAPAVVQAEAQARAASAQVGVSRSQYFPTISGSYSQSWAGAQVGSLQNSWSARLSMSFPIFNGFTRETGMTRSRAAEDAAAARVDDARRQVAAQLTQQFASLDAATVRYEIARASRAAAEEDLRVQQERYRLGAATIVEVLTSQENLDQAEVDLVQTRLDYLIARAEIESLIGREL